jgi:hypothetical protein
MVEEIREAATLVLITVPVMVAQVLLLPIPLQLQDAVVVNLAA